MLSARVHPLADRVYTPSMVACVVAISFPISIPPLVRGACSELVYP
jgi:hypothetical protein